MSRIGAFVPADAIEHLLELVLAEQHRLHVAERRWPAAGTLSSARDGAIARLQAQAGAGDARSVRTLAALIQAAFDVEFAAIANHLDQPGESTP